MRDADRLVGAGETEIDDPVAKKEIGRARIEFYADGASAYITIERERRQIIRLTYSVVGDKLATDQPAYLNPQEDKISDFGPVLAPVLWDNRRVLQEGALRPAPAELRGGLRNERK
jgi:hypothetical protein